MKWRRDSTYVGLRGRTEPNHVKGSAAMYGTGAEITPLDSLGRSILNPPPPLECNYSIQAWKKYGHLKDEQLFEGYSTTVEEGKQRCDEWLACQSASTKERRSDKKSRRTTLVLNSETPVRRTVVKQCRRKDNDL